MAAEMKNTRQRRAILEALAQCPQPVTAEQLAEKVGQLLPGVALSTIYRNLEKMAEAGVITRLMFDDGAAHYETPHAVHGHYVVCTRCSRKVRIGECPLETLTGRLQDETGFAIQGHNLQLYGVCPECQKKDS